MSKRVNSKPLALLRAPCTNARVQWIAPAVLTACVIAFIFLFVPIVFRSDDDYVLMACLNGTLTGTPSFFCSYTNPIFACFISALYTLTRAVNWYVLYHYVFLFAGITVIGRCILRVSARRGIAFWKALVLFAWLLVALLFYPLTEISFTLTSVISCTASVALILTLDFRTDSRRCIRTSYVLTALLMFAAYILRSLSTLAVLCFLALAFAYQALRLYLPEKSFRSRDMKGLLLCLLCCTLLIVGSSAAKAVEKSRYEEFNEFNLARSLYMDYPHQSYDEMQDKYEQWGMSEELVYILNQWCFADEKINAESLRALSGGEAKVEHSLTLTVHRGGGLFLKNKFAFSGLAFCLALSGLVALAALSKPCRKESWAELLTALCAMLGAFAQCFVLCWVGRFIFQVFYSIAIPCAVTILLMLLRSAKGEFPTALLPEKLHAKGLWKVLFYGVICCAMLLTCYKPVHYTMHPRLRAEKAEKLEHVRAFYRYIMDHPDNAYMYDAASKYDVDPFPERINESRSNAIAWGDSFYHSPIYDAQVESIGRDTFYMDALLDENVYFISDPEEYSISGVLTYVCQEYGAVAMEITDTIGEDLNVYHFETLPVAKDYTGWYEAYGMRYYFRDGVAQTGWFYVDGKKYFGVPMSTYGGDEETEPIAYYSQHDYEENGREYTVCTGYSVLCGGAVSIDGETYLFDDSGAVQTGWAYYAPIGWCWFDRSGALFCSDSIEQDGMIYCFDNTGKVFLVIPKSAQFSPPLYVGSHN